MTTQQELKAIIESQTVTYIGGTTSDDPDRYVGKHHSGLKGSRLFAAATNVNQKEQSLLDLHVEVHDKLPSGNTHAVANTEEAPGYVYIIYQKKN